MVSYLKLFFRFLVRPWRAEKLRTAITVLAVALGVAVVLAIELAGSAAAGSFQSSVETLAGAPDFEISAIGGVPEGVLGTLVALPYPLEITPRIDDRAVVEQTHRSAPLIGVDLVTSAVSVSAAAAAQMETEALRGTDSIWVGRELGLKAGEPARLLIDGQMHEFHVRGVLGERSADAIIMDIGLASRVLRRNGRIDRILVRAPSGSDLDSYEKILAGNVPADVSVERSGAKTAENRQMLQAFRWNLRVLSYIALVVGAFLIYNTISVSVVRRRAEIGALRALGASRGLVLVGFAGEAACFGLVGSILGLLLGRFMALGAVGMVAATVDSLYISSRPAPIAISAGTVLFATFLGTGVALLSALSPAWEAALVAPVEAMARGRREYQVGLRKGRGAVWAVALGCSAAWASTLGPTGGKPLFGYVAALFLIAAMALAIPALVAGVAVAARGALRRIGVEALLAGRSLSASLRRTSVLTAALSTAVAMMVAVAIMVGSFRQTVVIWMGSELPADLYLRPAGPAAADRHPIMSASIPERIARLPEVQAVDRFRAYAIRYEGRPATLGGSDFRISGRFGQAEFLGGVRREDVVARISQGDYVVISEPFANKHHLSAGSTLRLPLAGRAIPFQVLGVYYDYANEQGYVIMDRSTLLRYLPDPAASNLAVYLKPGMVVDQARQSIEHAVAGSRLAIFSNRELRTEAIRIFDRTFAITYALEGVAVVVAVMGVMGALLALVIDRRRELGLLRFLGASGGQIRSLILYEAGILGLLSNGIGLVLGVLLSLLLTFVINKQSFGWTIQFHWPVAVLLGALSIVYAATVLAGLYPARIAMRLNPIEVIHEE